MNTIRESWPKPLEAFLEMSGQYPNKRLGQHFLIDPSVLDKTIKAGQITSTDTVIEIGAGCGILTERLLAHAGRVVAVEIDGELVSFLNTYYKDEIRAGKLQVLEQDARTFDPAQHAQIQRPYKIVGNIPYYLTSPLIRHFLQLSPKPELILFLIQREVAERICAKPGEMNMLSLMTQLVATPEIVARVPKEAFYPSPKVESALIKITIPTNPRYKISPETKDQLMSIAKHAFSKKRKTIVNALESSKQSKEEIRAALDAATIEQQKRPQDLSIEQWIELTNVLTRVTIK